MLYQSANARHALKVGYGDTVTLFYLLGYLFAHNIFLLPTLISCFFIPKRNYINRHFTWHAELLPQTEQVIFHKTGPFGILMKYYVDIKNLEKTTPEEIGGQQGLFKINLFDNEIIFRDKTNGEVFVFEKKGIWNKDAVEHPLLV